MGMSTTITGFINPDPEYRVMRDAWYACKAAGVNPPDEVYSYFHRNTIEGEPSQDGISIDLTDVKGVTQLSGESGFFIDLDELPEDIRRIRFENSW